MITNLFRTMFTRKPVLSYLRELWLGISVDLVIKLAAKLWLLLIILLFPTDSTVTGYMEHRDCAPTVALIYTNWPERSAVKCRKI